MTTTPPPLDFQHLPGYEIPTKHKEAIRQLHWFGHVPVLMIQERYHLNESSVRRILSFDYPERRRPNRTGPAFLLLDTKVNEIINYLSESWEHRILKYDVLHAELGLKCSVPTLERRLKQRGYFRCTAYQKPYLTKAQVITRYLWAIAHIFWHTE